MAKATQKMMTQSKSLGLYVHIPFCRIVCPGAKKRQS